MTYQVGYNLTDASGKAVAVFAGYLDGNETWCDIGEDNSGTECLFSPEIKTFVRFTENGLTEWSMNIDAFAQSIARQIFPN